MELTFAVVFMGRVFFFLSSFNQGSPLFLMANPMAWSKFVSPRLPLNLFRNGTCCNPAAFPFTTDGVLILQTWPLQWPVAQQGHLRTLGRRLSLHPYLWHGIRLSVVSTPLSLLHFPFPV